MIVAIMTTALSGTAWAETKTEGFETATAGSNYQGTVTLSSNESDCGIGWEIYYGCVSTSSKITGNNSAALRLYTSNNYGYLKTTTPIDGLSNVTFNAKAATTNSASIKIDIKYSSDGSTWNNIETGKSLTTSSASYSVDIPSGGKYFQIAISSSSTKPSSKNAQLTIDDVVFTSTSGSSAVATETTIDANGITNTDIYAGTEAGSLSASVTAGGSAVAGATVTWSGNNNSVATIDSSTGVVTLVSAGTVTFTARYAGVTGEYQASYTTYEMTVTSSAPDYTTLPFSWEGGASSALLAKAGVTANGLGSDYAASNAPYLVKFDTTGDYIQIKTASQPGKVTIDVKMLGGTNTSSITVQESADGEKFKDVQILSISGNSNTTELTLETTNDFAATTRYVRLLFTKGSNVGVGAISIALPSNDPVISAEDASIAYNTTSGSIEYEIVHPVEGGTISASTDAAWLTFGSTGTAFTAEENTNISARVANVTLTYTYNTSETVTKEITLTQGGDPNTPGTEDNPYTVAQARAAIDAGTGVTGVYVSGIVSQVDSYNSTYHSITYWISDDGTTTSDQFEVYSGKGINGADFSSVNDIKVGDVVVVYGDIKKYNSDYEFNYNNELVSLQRPAGAPTVTIGTQTNVASVEMWYVAADLVEFESGDEVVAGVEVFVEPTAETGYTIQSVEVVDADDTSVSVTENTGKWSFTMPNKSVIVNITAVESSVTPVTGGATVTFDFATNSFNLPEGSTNKETESANFSDGTYSITLAAANGYYWNTDGYVLLGKANSTLTFPAFPFNVSKISITGTSSASDQVQQNIYVGDDAVSTATTGAKNVTNEYEIAANKQTAGTIYTLKVTSAHNTQITKIEVFGYESVTVTDAGYATFASDNALDFTNVNSVKAYIATADGTTGVTFSQINKVPANTGVLLVGTEGETVNASVPCLTGTADATTNNVFVPGAGVAVSSEGTGVKNYILSNGSEGVGFYPASGKTVAVGKAYISVSTETNVKGFIMLPDSDDPTAIEMVNGQSSIVNEIYNLAGQRISKMQKGINIVNGKKILK